MLNKNIQIVFKKINILNKFTVTFFCYIILFFIFYNFYQYFIGRVLKFVNFLIIFIKKKSLFSLLIDFFNRLKKIFIRM